MSSFKERMGRLRGTGGEAGQIEGTDEPGFDLRPEDWGEEEGSPAVSAWGAMGVAPRKTEKGSFLQRKEAFAETHRHGTHVLGEWRDAAPGLRLFHPAHGEMEAERILYLDLETTGLGAGTGNVPFMVGLAYFEGGQWIVEQNLIRHPSEEYAMLHELSLRLDQCTHLATYNGKSFDWPLIKSRLIMNRIPLPAKDPLHLDFLHPSRSVWRNTLPSLKLSRVEEERLGIERHDDVPGSLAPSLYFDYLANGNPAPLDGVFRHNASDLLSLVCLSIRFGFLLEGSLFERLPYPETAEELVRSGLWLEKMGIGELAESLFNLADGKSEAPTAVWIKLAERDKKAGNWQRAVLLWQKVIRDAESRRQPEFREACVQLAMYCEHREKNLDKGLQYAQMAMEHAGEGEAPKRRAGAANKELEGIRARVERLQRKVAAHHS